MNTYVETKLLSITSSSATIRNNGTFFSNVVFECNNFIKNDSIISLDVGIIHAEIPVSFYVINDYNNQFRFKLFNDPITTVSITNGNYNATSLIDALKIAINDTNFLITISKLTGKLTMTHNKSFIMYNNFTNSIGSILGFDTATVNNSVGSSNPYTLTPPNMVNLLGAKKLNILSTELNTINYSSEVGSLSMLSSIAIDQPAYGLIIYENKSGIRHNLKVKDINKVDIQIVDEYHDFINFNNIDWSMLLCFYITRENQLVLKDLDMQNLVVSPPKPEQPTDKNVSQPPEPPKSKDLSQLEFLSSI